MDQTPPIYSLGSDTRLTSHFLVRPFRDIFSPFPTSTMCDTTSPPDLEKGESPDPNSRLSPLHRVDSSRTLTNSTFPTPQQSRDSSVERQKRTRPTMGGHLEKPSVGVRTRRYLYHDLDTSYSQYQIPTVSYINIIILTFPSLSGPCHHCVLLHFWVDRQRCLQFMELLRPNADRLVGNIFLANGTMLNL